MVSARLDHGWDAMVSARLDHGVAGRLVSYGYGVYHDWGVLDDVS